MNPEITHREPTILDQPVVPRRLSVDRSSPYFNIIYRRLGVRFNGVERRGDVQEYDVDAGWIMIRKRDPMTKKFLRGADDCYVFEKLEGRVQPYFMRSIRRPEQTLPQAVAAISAAEAKRQRKAAKLREMTT